MLKQLPARPRISAQQGISRIAIVASRYNAELVEPMVTKAQQAILALEPQAKIEVVHTPGSFEIPFLTRVILDRHKPDAVICLGVILRGETGHADLIAASVSNTLCQLSVETSTPVIHGVLLLSSEEQARERCIGDEFNRGTEAAHAALEALHAAKSIITTR